MKHQTNAPIVEDDAEKLLVKAGNPPPAPAVMRVLAKSAGEALHPLPENVLLGGPAGEPQPGEWTIPEFRKPLLS